MVVAPPKIKHCGRIWPNGEFGTSLVRESLFSESHHETVKSQDEIWASERFAVHGYEATKEYLDSQRATVDNPGLSLVQNSPKTFRKGLKGISSKGKKIIRCGGEWLERRYTRARLTFATVTVPSVSLEELSVLVENWSEICRLFLRDLGRDLSAKGLPTHALNVTELQEKRGSRTGIPAPHLHFCFVGRDGRGFAWKVTRSDVRRLWKKQMDKWLDRDVDCSACENVVGVKHSASGYMGKYMSKGAKDCQALIDKGLSHLIPRTWWNCTQELRNIILNQVIRSTEAIGWLQSLCDAGHAHLFAFIRPVLINRADGTTFQIGWVGRFHPKWKNILYQQALAITVDARDKLAAMTQSGEATGVYAMSAWEWSEARYIGDSNCANSVCRFRLRTASKRQLR